MKCCVYIFVANSELSVCEGGNHYLPLQEDPCCHIGDTLLMRFGDTYDFFTKIGDVGIDLINGRKIYYAKHSGEYDHLLSAKEYVKNFLKNFFNPGEIADWWEGNGEFPSKTKQTSDSV